MTTRVALARPVHLRRAMHQALPLLALLVWVCAHPAPPAPPPVASVVARPPDPAPAPEAPVAPAVATVPEGCTADGALALHEAPRDERWVAACAELGEERVFTAWREAPTDDLARVTLTLRIAVVRGGAIVWRVAEALDTEPTSEDWTPSPASRVAGAPGGLRVGLLGATGEDYRTASERALVFRALGGGRYARVWAGEGDLHERSMDACFRTSALSARFVDATTLALTRATRAYFHPQRLERGLLARLRRECRGAAPRTERVTVAP